MPDVVGALGRDDMASRIFSISGIRDSLFPEDSPNGCRPQVQARPAESVGDSDFSHGGGQGLEPPDEVADKIGVPVDRNGQMKQCVRPSSSRRADHEAMVAAVIRKVSAVCFRDQPLAALSSRIAMRSYGP